MSNKKEREKRREERLAEEQKVSSSDNRRQRLLQMAAGAVFLVVVAVVVLVVANSSSSDSGGDSNIEEVGAVDSLFNGIPQEGLMLGKASAPVELIEFGDLQCPVCKEYSEEILPEVIENKVKSGEAKIDFRNFTIISEESVPAGAAAIAAGKQGRGWYFIELFYRNQGEERSGYVTDEFLTSIAKGAGVKDMAKWNKERKDPKTTKEVEATYAEAQKFGFNGTPSFAIQGPSTNGVELPGTLQTPGEFEEAIEEAS
ncbi:MAG TPA: thioredoxin domain-containing protein [Solirubrobacterales bacterium]|nr:thioredoxin domain-containing protein [Solirubrobacterales bacterium]